MTANIIIPPSAIREMASLPKYPERYTIEDENAFLGTLSPEHRGDGEAMWERLDERENEKAWAIVDALKRDGGLAHEQLYSMNQLSELWQVSKRSLMRWMQGGRLRAIKLGSLTRIRERDARAFERNALDDDKKMFGSEDG
jgi:hypothetical protein